MNLNSGMPGPCSGGFEPADLSSSFAARPVWVLQPDSVLPGAWHAGGAGDCRYICYIFSLNLVLVVLVVPVGAGLSGPFGCYSGIFCT